jgi:hypothetical protein
MMTVQIILMSVSGALCLISAGLVLSGRSDLRKQLELDRMEMGLRAWAVV